MAIDMRVAPTGGRSDHNAYEQSVSLTAAGDSDWIIVPNDVNSITYILTPGSGATGRVEVSTSDVDTTKTGSPIAVAWPAGLVSVATSDSSRPVTAVRLTQVGAGTTRLDVRAQ